MSDLEFKKPWWTPVAFGLTVFGLLCILYSPSFSGPLAFDDYQITPNPTLTWHRPESRPLVMLLFSWEQSLFGTNPFVFRLTNVFIHTLAACFLYGIVRRLSERSGIATNSAYWLAGFAAVLWAVHPLQTAAVAYVIQRAESLMGMFFLAYLLCIILDQERIERAVVEPTGHSALSWLSCRRWLVVAGACFMAGLWSKTIMITALAVGPLMDRAFLSANWWAVIRNRGLVSLLPAAAGVVAVLSLIPGLLVGESNVGFGGDAPPVANYLAAQAEVLWRYVWLAIAPNHLSIDPGMRAPTRVSEQLLWITLTAFWILAGAVACWFGRWRTGFLLLAPLLVLSPTSSFIPTADLIMEHRTYLPLAVFASVVGFAGLLLANQVSRSAASAKQFVKPSTKAIRTSPKLIPVFAGVLVVCFSLRTFIRAGDYRSGYQLWSQAVLLNPDNDRAIQNTIDASRREGREEDILPLLVRVVEQCELSNVTPTVPLQRLGEEYVKYRQPRSGISALRRAIELDEQQRSHGGYRDVHRVRDRAAMHVNYALALLQIDEENAAYEQILLAFEHSDGNAEARALAGQLASKSGKPQEAKLHFARALELRPDWPEVTRDFQALQAQ
jgi:protein O-mannosyl-transferase